MTELIRKLTDAETTGDDPVTPIALPGGKRVREPKSEFKAILALEEQKARKKGLPFAAKAAEDDYDDDIEKQKKIQKRLYGKPVSLKMPKLDWSKYYDLKNFKVIDEGERKDDSLSDRFNVLVYIKKTKYQFKGYSNTYTIMEEPTESLRRAKELAKA